MMMRNSEGDVPTVESPDVELTGRRFPALWDEPESRPRNRIRQLTAEPCDADLPDRLADEVRSRLPWSALPVGMPDAQRLVESYVASLAQLNRFRDDVHFLLRAACEASLEFRQEAGETHGPARDAALRSALDEMLAAATCDWLPTPNVLDARLAARPVAELRPRLDAAHEQAVRDFSRGLCESLARMVDREAIGLVEWLPGQGCSYHFFRRVVIQENDGPRETTRRAIDEWSEPDAWDPIDDDGEGEFDAANARRIVGWETVTETRGRGRHQHRCARHQHDVMHAVQTTIDNSDVAMPPAVVRACQAVPEWLRPIARIIDGTIVRERVVERDLRVENWQDVRVRDEPIFGCEPGLIIGPYVLIGWGPREVEAERQRRTDAQQSQHTQETARAASYERIGWIAASAFAALGGIVLFHRDADGSSRIGAAAAFLGCLFATTQVVRCRRQADRREAGILDRLASLLAASVAIAAGLLFVESLRSESLPGVAAAVVVGLLAACGLRALGSSSAAK